jgi:FMN-dependent NADH-azoreductase
VSTLLQIIATPHQNGNSQTRHLAESFIEAWQTVHPSGVIETLDLSKIELPPMDETMVSVVFDLESKAPPEEVARRRRTLDRLVAQFISADAYLIVTPMWNFGLPYTLKHYFDLVIRPGWTFNIGADGPVGLLEGRSAYAVVTRGFDYGPDSPHPEYNHLEPHLRTLLGFMGIRDLSVVAAEGMMLPGASERMEEAMRAATAMGLGLVAA